MNKHRQTPPTHRTRPSLSQWARRYLPGRRTTAVPTNSTADPRLQEHNLIVTTDEPHEARAATLALEHAGIEHASLGAVVVTDESAPGHSNPTGEADPGGVTGHAVRRASKGAAIGIAVCAVAVGLATWFVTLSGTAALAGAIGGAAFGAFVGSVWSFVIGTGHSPAFAETFADTDDADVTVTSVHTDDPDTVARAREAIGDIDGLTVHYVDAGGSPLAGR